MIDWNDAVAREAEEMRELLARWCGINSFSNHGPGLDRMLEALVAEFSRIDGRLELVACDGALPDIGVIAFERRALRMRYDAGDGRAPVLLNGHYDTVYANDGSFQTLEFIDGGRARGPGVTDMKGGLVVILSALKLWQALGRKEAFSWEVLITPDEEIGSPASIPLLKESAERCRFGFVYESSLVDGGFVRKRKGTGTYSITAQGLAAHVGRDFESGRNAIVALGALSLEVVEPGSESYTFVVEETGSGRILGISAVDARTGGFDPFFTFERVCEDERYEPLGIHQTLEVLRCRQ
jgi:glutamate carboxypeptidase